MSLQYKPSPSKIVTLWEQDHYHIFRAKKDVGQHSIEKPICTT